MSKVESQNIRAQGALLNVDYQEITNEEKVFTQGYCQK